MIVKDYLRRTIKDMGMKGSDGLVEELTRHLVTLLGQAKIRAQRNGRRRIMVHDL